MTWYKYGLDKHISPIMASFCFLQYHDAKQKGREINQHRKRVLQGHSMAIGIAKPFIIQLLSCLEKPIKWLSMPQTAVTHSLKRYVIQYKLM